MPRCRFVYKFAECINKGHISSGIVLLGQPNNVTLDRLADPRCTDSVYSRRADEISIEHDNLLSEKTVQEIIAQVGVVMCPRRMAGLLQIGRMRQARAHNGTGHITC